MRQNSQREACFDAIDLDGAGVGSLLQYGTESITWPPKRPSSKKNPPFLRVHPSPFNLSVYTLLYYWLFCLMF